MLKLENHLRNRPVRADLVQRGILRPSGRVVKLRLEGNKKQFEVDYESWSLSEDTCQVAHGHKFSLRLTTSGKVYQIDIETKAKLIRFPYRVTIRKVACGRLHSCALSNEGDVYSWGSSRYGQLGHGDFRDQSTPAKVTEPLFVQSCHQTPVSELILKCGPYTSAVLTFDGVVWLWGKTCAKPKTFRSTGGEFRIVSTDRPTISPHASMVEGQIRDFGIGLEHFVFLAAKCVWAFGGGKKGQLGAGPNCSGSYLPLKVINEVKSLAVGLYHTSVITEAGTVLTWGCNDIGACGSSDQNRIHPSPVALDIKGIDFDSANLSVYNHGTVLSDCNQICVWGKVTEAEPIRRPHFLNDIRASNLELIQAAPNYLTLLVSKRNPLYRIAHVAVGSSKRMLFGLPNETQQVLCGQFIKLSVLSIYDTGDVLTVRDIDVYFTIVDGSRDTKPTLVGKTYNQSQGRFSLNFKQDEAVSWDIHVTLRGFEIFGSPYRLTASSSSQDGQRQMYRAIAAAVSPVCDGSSGKPMRRWQTLQCRHVRIFSGDEVMFQLEAENFKPQRDSTSCPLELEFIGPTRGRGTISGVSNTHSLLVGKLRVKETGRYVIHIRYTDNGKDIEQSPITVDVVVPDLDIVQYVGEQMQKLHQIFKKCMDKSGSTLRSTYEAELLNDRSLKSYLAFSALLDCIAKQFKPFDIDRSRTGPRKNASSGKTITWREICSIITAERRRYGLTSHFSVKADLPLSARSSKKSPRTDFHSYEHVSLSTGGITPSTSRTTAWIDELSSCAPSDIEHDQRGLVWKQNTYETDLHLTITSNVSAISTSELLCTSPRNAPKKLHGRSSVLDLCVHPVYDDDGEIEWIPTDDSVDQCKAGLSRQQSRSFIQQEKLRRIILDRMQRADRSVRDVFQHFDTDKTSRFDMNAFVVGLDDIRFHLVPEERYQIFSSMNLDESGKVCLGEFKTFLLDPNHKVFWSDFVTRFTQMLTQKNEITLVEHFNASCAKLNALGFDKVGFSKQQYTWKVFVYAVRDLLPSVTGQEMARLLNRFDTNGNGVVDLARFRHALRPTASSESTSLLRFLSDLDGNVLPTHPPKIEDYMTPQALSKLYRLRSKSLKADPTGSLETLMKKGNDALASAVSQSVSWRVKEGLAFRPGEHGSKFHRGKYRGAKDSANDTKLHTIRTSTPKRSKPSTGLSSRDKPEEMLYMTELRQIEQKQTKKVYHRKEKPRRKVKIRRAPPSTTIGWTIHKEHREVSPKDMVIL